jgi:hypothetical protein
MQCSHSRIISGYCTECKELIQDFTENEGILTDKDIYSPALEFVSKQIISIAREMRNEFKLRRDKKTAFITLYLAHIKQGINIDSLTLSKCFNLTRKEYNKCMLDISSSSLNGNRNIENSISILIKLPESSFEEMLGDQLQEYIEVLDVCKKITEENIPFVYSCQPQIVAYVALWLYCKKKNKKLPKNIKRCSNKQIELYRDFVQKYI